MRSGLAVAALRGNWRRTGFRPCAVGFSAGGWIGVERFARYLARPPPLGGFGGELGQQKGTPPSKRDSLLSRRRLVPAMFVTPAGAPDASPVDDSRRVSASGLLIAREPGRDPPIHLCRKRKSAFVGQRVLRSRLATDCFLAHHRRAHWMLVWFVRVLGNAPEEHGTLENGAGGVHIPVRVLLGLGQTPTMITVVFGRRVGKESRE